MALLASSRVARGITPGQSGQGTRRAAPLLPPAQPSLRRTVTSAQKQQFASFDDMLNRSEVPLLVDFYATWCGPCQMMSPVLSAVASKLKGRVQVVKIDTDKYPAVASQHRVQALPTIALFVRGKIVFRFEGALTEAQLTERLNYHLISASQPQGAQ